MFTKEYTISVTQEDIDESKKLVKAAQGTTVLAQRGDCMFNPIALAITRHTKIRLGIGPAYAYEASIYGYNGRGAEGPNRLFTPEDIKAPLRWGGTVRPMTFNMVLPTLDEVEP